MPRPKMTEGAQGVMGSVFPAFGAPVTVAQLYEFCKASPFVAFDTETNTPLNVDPTFVRDSITICSFAWGPREEDCTALPAGDGTFDRGPTEHIDEFLLWLLNDYEGRVGAHNTKFDLHMIRKQWGIHASKLLDDTMIQCHLLDENRPKALKKQGDILGLDAERFSGPVKRFMANNRLTSFGQLPFSVFGPYSAYDTFLTWRLDAYNQKVTEWPEFAKLYDTELRLTERVLTKMEEQGVLINRDFLVGKQSEMVALQNKLQTRIDDIVGRPVETGSDDQMSKLLYEELGFPVVQRNKLTPRARARGDTEGGASTDTHALAKLRAQTDRSHKHYPLLGLIERWRDADKQLTTYVIPTLFASQWDGRVHPDWNTCGARPGRFSCSNPNVQQVPTLKEDEPTSFMRYAYIADPGIPMDFLDYDQIEMRGFAHYTGEERLIDTFVKGEDVYSEMATWIYGGTRDQYPKGTPERSVGKTVALAIIYGAGAEKIGEHTGKNKAEGQKILDLFRKGSPKSAKLLDGVRQRLNERHYIVNGFGRRRRDCTRRDSEGHYYRPQYHENCPPCEDYKVVNSLIQGWAADLIKNAMVRIEEDVKIPTNAGQGWRKQVHDEIRLDGLEPKMIQEVRAVMCDYDLRVPINVSVAHSTTNWAEAEKA